MFYTISLNKIKKPVYFLLLLALVVFLGGLYVNIRYPIRYIGIITENTAKYGMEPSLICAVIHTESKFNSLALSNKGASGLMQVTKNTADWIASEMDIEDYSYDQIFEPEMNIKIGCYYIDKLLHGYSDLDVALAAYNAGSGNVNKWLTDSTYSEDGRTLSAIPFKETRDYINRVRNNKRIYDFLLKIAGAGGYK